MRHQVARWLAALTCLAFLLAGAPAAEAAKHKKSWPSKKSHKPKHKKSPSPASSKSGAPAPADDGDDDADENETAQGGGGDEEEADAPAFKPKKVAKAKDEDEDEDGDNADSDSGDEDGSPVVRKKARKVAVEGDEGAPIAFEVMAGPRGVNRTFNFNDPLVPGAAAYKLPVGPSPFIDLAIYPLAFASRGFLANIGLIGKYERLIGTSTVANKGQANETTSTTQGQQFEGGVRVRFPLSGHEVGVALTYGQHAFWLASKDPGPAGGSVLPNVTYGFVGAGADARLRFGIVTLGAHAGTRFVLDEGSLGSAKWFKNTQTTSVNAGGSLAVRVAPMFEVVAGVDFLRYAFDFKAKPTDAQQSFIAGGAVDQYISFFGALRVSITGG